MRRLLACSLAALASLVLASPGRAVAADASPIVTVNPVVLKDAAQGKELLVRVTAPVAGRRLPIVVFSHGAQYSKDDYLPLTEYWAAHGYAVLQPTHIESLSLGLPRDDARVRDAWKSRVLDMKKILDSLQEIERQAPMLKGRLDRSRILAAGHSFGGHTTAALIGGRMPDTNADFADPRIMAGVLLAPPGSAPGFRNVVWGPAAKPALFVVGLDDIIPGFNDDWRAHADYYYNRAGGPQCLAGLTGMKHYLGGILGTHRTEEKTPSPESLEWIQRTTLAFLDGQARGSKDWERARAALLAARPAVIGVFECR